MTWEHVRGRIEAMGLPYESVQAEQAALADPHRWFHGPVRVGAWGRA
jgi:hypothetical protein